MPRWEKVRHAHGMSAAVLWIGVFSILLLLWAHRINERLRNSSDIVDALMDVQIHTATYHLWLEEAIAGNVPVTVKEAMAHLDQAVSLVNATLEGGEAGHDRISEPLDRPELRSRAETAKSLLVKLKTLGLARERHADRSGSGSALEQEFHAVFKESLAHLRVLEDVLKREEAEDEREFVFLFLSILLIWAVIVAAATAGLWMRERERARIAGELLEANRQLHIQAEELAGHRLHLEELVEKRTAELTSAAKLLRAEMKERQQTCEMLTESEQQVRELSSKLLSAQEIERRRISMELHDELGQALTAIKLRMRVMERGLQEDQREMREECERLLEYVDQVIGDVRSLSLALSPTVLEDLGLASALRWLAGNLAKIPEMRITTDIAEIDPLVPRDQWITVYRVMQEAITNVGKHARAEHISVMARCHDHRVLFSVEDDGNGFDLEEALRKNAHERGLGLTTMTERVRMMGGDIDLWSRPGEGTRVTFSMPLAVC